jgi:hypothetical protein
MPYELCSDGSIRSLDETLLDTYRRVCRLLFRAAGSGAVASEVFRSSRPRVLFVCRRDGELFARLNTFREASSDCHVFAISADVRQLPIMTRLYGPTHLVVDSTYGSALWDQLRTVRSLPEGRQLAIIAVTPPDAGVAVPDIETMVRLGPDLIETLRRELGVEQPRRATALAAYA